MLRTSRQRKDLCRDCAIAKAADIIGDTCSLILVRDLLEGPKRYTDLTHSLKGVSSRTLTKKLKTLQISGLLTHTDHLYELTRKGQALEPILVALRIYGEKYL